MTGNFFFIFICPTFPLLRFSLGIVRFVRPTPFLKFDSCIGSISHTHSCSLQALTLESAALTVCMTLNQQLSNIHQGGDRYPLNNCFCVGASDWFALPVLLSCQMRQIQPLSSGRCFQAIAQFIFSASLQH
ncbi:MAG: hypothetical protein CLLPBCKN_000309 [Chroococcidiopsis cubana SAG 39.79]|nr:hypothetical protein [Chroococcidiopsis cubana SAG 39.79]